MRGKMLGAGGGDIDIDQLTAGAGTVVEGLTFYGAGSDEMQTGEMSDIPAVDEAHDVQVLEGSDTVKVCISRGAHRHNGETGYPEVNFPLSLLIELIGLTAEIIANGRHIAGVTGTYGADGTLQADKMVAGLIGYGPDGRVVGSAADRGSVYKTLAAGDVYEIVQGFFGSGKITAKDLASQTAGTAAAAQILAGYIAWVNGIKVTGSIASKEAATYNTSESDQTIAAKQYLSGAQTIRGVKTSNIAAGNIKHGVTVKVGDEGSAGRIANVQGTFTSDGTAAAGDMLSGKVAYVKGSKVTGNIASKAAATYNTSGSDQTIAAGQYLSGAQTIRAVTTENISAENIRNGVTVKVGDAGSAGRIKNVTGTWKGNLKIIRLACYVFTEGDPTRTKEESFTLPQNGTVYYTANTLTTSSDGYGESSVRIYKNGALMHENYVWRYMTQADTSGSFAANKNDVIKVVAVAKPTQHPAWEGKAEPSRTNAVVCILY